MQELRTSADPGHTAANYDSFTRMLRDALGDRLAPGAATFADMFADDGVFEFPFAPPGMARVARGRSEIDRHLASLTDLALDEISRPTIRWIAGTDAVVLEFEARGRNTRTGAPYDQRYVSLVELHDGRITLFRDYWNPLATLAAFGGADDVLGRWDRARPSSAFTAGPAIENSLFYMGSLMSVLAPTKRTGGAFSLLEYRSRPGHEPPPHIHLGQDELLYLLEGTIEAYTPDLTAARVEAGEALFLPRDRAHAWYVTSPTLRMLILTNPAGMDDYFAAMAEPATSLELPAQGTTYAMDDPGRAIEIGRRFGLRFLSPEETREMLPGYPGFGVKRAAT